MSYLKFYKSKLKKFAYGGPMANANNNISFDELAEDPLKIRSNSILNKFLQNPYDVTPPTKPSDILYDEPSVKLNEQQQILYYSLNNDSKDEFNRIMKEHPDYNIDTELSTRINDIKKDAELHNENSAYLHAVLNGMSKEDAEALVNDPDRVNAYINDNNITTDSTGRTIEEANSDMSSVIDAENKVKLPEKFNISQQGQKGLAIGTAAMLALDKGLMGDKNFGALSEAIDSAVHGASAALMNSGNPYAMAAGAALEAANFMTKAGGQTVQGYDVDINSSGYGLLAHLSSSSSRDFGAMIGLGGLNAGAINRKLAKRNEQMQMALKAANIADDISFEQEARENSVEDTMQRNEIALLGGIDTTLLAAKNGAKLERKEEQTVVIDLYPEEEVVIAKNGAKLEKVETSEEPNVIPEGALHKNKNHLDLETTQKGIPVITTENELEEGTFEEIKQNGGEITLHAEIEDSEIIFSKELTDYIEENRKEWHDNPKNQDLLLNVGKRIVKEILTNTDDNTDLISKMEELV